MDTTRVVTVADFYHRSGNGPTNVNSGGAVLIYFIYLFFLNAKKTDEARSSINKPVCFCFSYSVSEHAACKTLK